MASKSLFDNILNGVLNIDPVYWVENNLTLDGRPFRLSGNGYKPFSDIYRYLGIRALEPDSKPVVMVKGRQVGATTMAAALELYFMASGLFGKNGKPPMRIMHCFPQLDIAFAYTKTKLNTMINTAVPIETGKRGVKAKTVIEDKLDKSVSANDSLQFKQFDGGNHIWIESTGVDGARVRGRQLALDTDIPTPTGFVKLSDLKEGDQLFDEQGNICNITKLHPINISPESYRITFDDGTTVDACAEHRWLTYTKRDRSSYSKFIRGKSEYQRVPKIKNTKEILQTLKVYNSYENNHSIPNCLPVNYPKKDLLVDPYLLGLWLGDGERGGWIETADPEILQEFEHRSSINHMGSFNLEPSKSCAYRVIGLTTNLRKLGLVKNYNGKSIHKNKRFYNKHIPQIYMHASAEQRLALLQGLLDTDGCCLKDGTIEFSQVRRELAYQVYDLILSLGIKAHIRKKEKWRYNVRYQDAYCIKFVTRLPVFKMKRKLQNIKTSNNAIMMTTHRFIKSIEPIDPVPMRCLTVDSPSHLFLITKSFIPTHNTVDSIFYDEVQEMPGTAIGNSKQILSKSQYGRKGSGVQLYFGTPRQNGTNYWKMWQKSSRQYYHLGCAKCKEYFPLYTPESDEWERIWLHGFIVKCTKCGHEQNKLDAAERGKWIASNPDPDCEFVGYHLNQLYNPEFTKEKIISEKPENSVSNGEVTYQNEVLGEFYAGSAAPITPDQIHTMCADPGRKFAASIGEHPGKRVYLGADWGDLVDSSQLNEDEGKKTQGKSYSCVVVLSTSGPNIFNIEFATRLKRNDPETKREIIEQMFRQYSVDVAVGDIGHAGDLSQNLQRQFGDKYIASRAGGEIKNHAKYVTDVFPTEIQFDREYYIGLVFDMMKKGKIKFPYGDFEKVAWLISHCCSMEMKPSKDRMGEIRTRYVKGSTPNDGFMALINAVLAALYDMSSGFTINNPNHMTDPNVPKQIMAITGYIPKMRR